MKTVSANLYPQAKVMPCLLLSLVVPQGFGAFQKQAAHGSGESPGLWRFLLVQSDFLKPKAFSLRMKLVRSEPPMRFLCSNYKLAFSNDACGSDVRDSPLDEVSFPDLFVSRTWIQSNSESISCGYSDVLSSFTLNF